MCIRAAGSENNASPPTHRQQDKKPRKRLWHDQHVAAFIFLGPMAVDYLNALADAGYGVEQQVKRLLVIKNRYGTEALIRALDHAMAAKAWGADYVENIVHQHSTPKNEHSPVRFSDERLNCIRLQQPCLAKAVAYAATQAGKKVLFTTAMDMINHLITAEADHSLLKKLHYYQSPELLVIDEIG